MTDHDHQHGWPDQPGMHGRCLTCGEWFGPELKCLVTACTATPAYLVVVPGSPARELAACTTHVAAFLALAITPKRPSVMVHGLSPWHVTTATFIVGPPPEVTPM